MPLDFTPQRLRRITWAVIAGLLIALVADLAVERPTESILRRGDFPGLYVQAEIIKRGQGAALYNPVLQQQIENELWPQFEGRFLMSVYPPSVGVALLPLTLFPLKVAQWLYTVLNLLALVTAVTLVRRSWGLGFSLESIVALLCFAPCFYGVLGGQNSGFSALLAAIIMHGLCRSDRGRGQFLVGIAAGLWCFKPQLGLYAVMLLCAVGAFRALGWAAAVGIGHYLLGALVVGRQWPWQLLESLRVFSPLNFSVNLAQQTSLFGASLGSPLMVVRLLAVVATVCMAFWLVCTLYRRRREPHPQERISLAFASIALLVPQTLFYDLSVAALFLVGLFRVSSWGPFLLLGSGICLSWLLTWNRTQIPIPTMLLIAIALPCSVLYFIRKRRFA